MTTGSDTFLVPEVSSGDDKYKIIKVRYTDFLVTYKGPLSELPLGVAGQFLNVDDLAQNWITRSIKYDTWAFGRTELAAVDSFTAMIYGGVQDVIKERGIGDWKVVERDMAVASPVKNADGKPLSWGELSNEIKGLNEVSEFFMDYYFTRSLNSQSSVCDDSIDLKLNVDSFWYKNEYLISICDISGENYIDVQGTDEQDRPLKLKRAG